ncbi:E3 ubiquitin-protein ligase TRIM39 [Megalops cyprinoides]|uniref:E3 ubiquitin-protein ligase TRIM39 n=1 Tax=Megalops cyprinoides TaxID=118141 RepID=UPI0018653DFB|nr:E3 ubiquitin-protein ligase TRIM39 [Megalops cyprinoides]
MKSILKEKTLSKSPVCVIHAAQSNSIGAVRWTLPEENLQAHSSAPSNPFKSPSSSSRPQQHPRQQGLQDLRSLQECVKFINHWKEEVVRVCKNSNDLGEGPSKEEPHKADSRTERSLEESRKLILQWADELKSVDTLFKECPWRQERDEQEAPESKDDDENNNKLVQERIMEWAKELHSVSESCGVPGEELAQMLRMLGLRKKRLVSLLPLLEFITWSLLKEDSKSIVPQLWLSAKQRTWKAGTPRYIPNSVWSWITSAAADVTLDPMTNHPWLLLSDDRRKVQEAHAEMEVAYSTQRFDVWPCVLGWEGFDSGRHYWEVDMANNGYWRVGVTTATSKRRGRFAMVPSQGYWTLWRSTRQFYACTKPETPLPVGLVPRKLGVYLDYEEGQISFYNVENKSHIYTFTDSFRGKLYPLFAPLDGRTLITVSSPNSVTEF